MLDWSEFRLHKRLSLKPESLEDIYGKLAEIDAVKNSWQITATLQPQTVERLSRSVLVTSTGASNRIEGNRLTDLQVETLYKNLRIKNFKSRDEQEVAGYLESLEFIFKTYGSIPVTETSLLDIHQNMLIYSEKDQHHKGGYKTGSNRVEARDPHGNVIGIIFDPTPPYLVKKEIQELLDWYNWAIGTKAKHPLLLIANFIFEYLAIHPFQDGNGRTSRLLTNLMMLQQGYLFARFVSHERIIEAHKVDYYLALNKTQSTWKTDEEDITPWVQFFLAVVQQQSHEALRIVAGEDISYLLSAKQLALWEWAQSQTEFSRKDAVAALGLAERTVESIIYKLIEMKKLTRLGQGRATRYQVLSSNREKLI
jgi:Fic family protein